MDKRSPDTQEKILAVTTNLVSLYGCDGITMRLVGKHVPIAQSVIYHYYADKDTLLEAVYKRANRMLGQLRSELPKPKSAIKRLRLLIQFQLDHAELIIAVLKYYINYRELFASIGGGTLPEKAILHVEEVLEYGSRTGEFSVSNLQTESKVVAHVINGYLLEYYPHMPTGKEAKELMNTIVSFTQNALAPHA